MALQISINEQSNVPIWVQLKMRLLHLIASGELHSGDQLPTVRELAAQTSVNYNTVSKVYQDLERDGYIVSKRGCGTFVADLSDYIVIPSLSPIDTAARDFIATCLENSLTTDEIAAVLNRHLNQVEKNEQIRASNGVLDNIEKSAEASNG